MCIHEFDQNDVCAKCGQSFEAALQQMVEHYGTTREELARAKVMNTKWVDPDIDEDAFWRQCTAVARIDPNWLNNWLANPPAQPAVMIINGERSVIRTDGRQLIGNRGWLAAVGKTNNSLPEIERPQFALTINYDFEPIEFAIRDPVYEWTPGGGLTVTSVNPNITGEDGGERDRCDL